MVIYTPVEQRSTEILQGKMTASLSHEDSVFKIENMKDCRMPTKQELLSLLPQDPNGTYLAMNMCAHQEAWAPVGLKNLDGEWVESEMDWI